MTRSRLEKHLAFAGHRRLEEMEKLTQAEESTDIGEPEPEGSATYRNLVHFA